MSFKDRVNLTIFTVIVCQMKQIIILAMQCFYLWRNKSPSVCQIRNKSAPITFNKSQVLAIGNQYHKDST